MCFFHVSDCDKKDNETQLRSWEKEDPGWFLMSAVTVHWAPPSQVQQPVYQDCPRASSKKKENYS